MVSWLLFWSPQGLEMEGRVVMLVNLPPPPPLPSVRKKKKKKETWAAVVNANVYPIHMLHAKKEHQKR